MWVRGLKRADRKLVYIQEAVAPRVGAWIETSCRLAWRPVRHVAPRVGAWIETIDVRDLVILKEVAPRVGAWIET